MLTSQHFFIGHWCLSEIRQSVCPWQSSPVKLIHIRDTSLMVWGIKDRKKVLPMLFNFFLHRHWRDKNKLDSLQPSTHCTKPERFTREKHSSLFCLFVGGKERKAFNVDTRWGIWCCSPQQAHQPVAIWPRLVLKTWITRDRFYKTFFFCLLPYFIEYNAHTSIVRTWILQWFWAIFLFFKSNFTRTNHCKFIHHKSHHKPFLSYLPCIVRRKYFSIIFNVKSCALYSIKYGTF